jgi:alkanesulfonate monooxygenase SsuD/methylene tetrahydromethanopterin reductase-like flavin-dependent oxidoreductase (luciferase family)
MNVGVGLPNTTPGADGELLVDWSRAADAGPFSSLGVLDRIVYDSYEPLTALAVAAAVTSRIRLATMIVIAPLRNTALLAKQAASVHAIAGGRLTLGLAVGARVEDYEAAAVDPAGRGERFSRQLAELREHWEDARIGPSPASGQRPELLVGGGAGAAFERMARYADGYAHGGGPARAFARAAASANAAWRDLGRPGRPKLWGQAYFTLGDDEAGDEYLRDYYAFTGPFAERIVAGNLRTPRAIRDFVRSYEAEGCDELVLLPTVSTLEQIERLAEVLG